MNAIKKIIFQICYTLKSISYAQYRPHKPIYIIKGMPYYSQFISSDLMDEILGGKKPAQEDLRWKESGATTKNEYAIWAHNGCGMACIEMILEKKLSRKMSLVELGKLCMSYGGYADNKSAQMKNDYTNYYNGLFYAPFLTFIKKEFRLNGLVVSPMVENEIIKALDDKKFVIASVHPAIKNTEMFPEGKRGHLVLVVGYDVKKKKFYLHNPSGIYKKSQQYADITFHDFNRYFAKRGIIID